MSGNSCANDESSSAVSSQSLLKQNAVIENSIQTLDFNQSEHHVFVVPLQYGIRRNAMDSHDIHQIKTIVLTDPIFERHRSLSLSEKCNITTSTKTSLSSVSGKHDNLTSYKPMRTTSPSISDHEHIKVRPRSSTLSSVTAPSSPSSFIAEKHDIGRWLRQFGLGYGTTTTTHLDPFDHNKIEECTKPQPQQQTTVIPSIRSRAFLMAISLSGGGETKVAVDDHD